MFQLWIKLLICIIGDKMANRRMFSLDVIDTDLFLDLPISSQALYFHLGMRADDDGFVSSPKRITSMIGANQDDLKLLIAKGFVILLEDGIVVIRHWKQNNYIQNDRYKKTIYQEQMKQLTVVDGIYTASADTKCIQSVSEMYPQDSIGKISINNKNTMCKSSDDNAQKLFEKLWGLYPNKKGKGAVSKSQKQKLLKIGFEEMERAVKRYQIELAKDTWRKPQNGSTFFNSGYVDYLDANYCNVQGSEVNGNQGGRQAADFYEQFMGTGDSDQS